MTCCPTLPPRCFPGLAAAAEDEIRAHLLLLPAVPQPDQQKFLAALDKHDDPGRAWPPPGRPSSTWTSTRSCTGSHDPALEKHYVPTRSQRARSVLTFFAQDTGTRNLVYANADISKASQAREAIAFCDQPGNRCPGQTRSMLHHRTRRSPPRKSSARSMPAASSSRPSRMRSASLVECMNSLAGKDFTTITLDRPGPHNKPRVHEDPAVTLTSYPGTARQLIVTAPRPRAAHRHHHQRQPDQDKQRSSSSSPGRMSHRAAARRDHPRVLRRRPVSHRHTSMSTSTWYSPSSPRP